MPDRKPDYDDQWRCRVCGRWWVVPDLTVEHELREHDYDRRAPVESEHRMTPATGATARGHGQPEEAG